MVADFRGSEAAARSAMRPLTVDTAYSSRGTADSRTAQAACPSTTSPAFRRDGVGRQPAASRTANNSFASGSWSHTATAV